MKFIWMSFIIVIIIKVTRAKNQLDIFLEYSNMDRDLSMPSRLPSYVIVKRRTVGLFPELPHFGNRFVVDFKPPKETYSQANHEQYKIMRELPIKDINKGKDMVKSEVTTRRPLMRRKKFTVRPHDVYRNFFRENNNWNSYKKNINKSRIPKKHTTVGTIYDTIKNESRFHSFKNFNMLLNDKDYNLLEKENKNSYVTPDSRKFQITLLLPKNNNIKYFKENPESVSKQFQINNFVSEIEVSFDILNNSYKSLIEEKENIKVPSNAFFKSGSKDEIDKVIESENNLIDQDELIPVRFNDISFLEPDFADDDDEITDGDIDYLVSRPKRGVNIIEEEGKASTLSGIRVTNQDHAITHDLTFKNIHT